MYLNEMFSSNVYCIKPRSAHVQRGTCYVLYKGFEMQRYQELGTAERLEVIVNEKARGRNLFYILYYGLSYMEPGSHLK